MKRTLCTAAFLAVALAGQVLAEGGATDPVMARKDLMSSIRHDFGTLGGMVQGKTSFDADAAKAALAGLQEKSGAVPDAFATNAMGGKTEADPSIWENWDDFVEHAAKLQEAVGELDVSSLDTLKVGFGAVGQACGACHKVYRVKK